MFLVFMPFVLPKHVFLPIKQSKATMSSNDNNDWTSTYDAVFFISAGTMFFAFLGLAIKVCLKSKCEQCSLCCGLLKIERRVDLEVQEEIRAMELHSQQNEKPQDKAEAKREEKEGIEEEENAFVEERV